MPATQRYKQDQKASAALAAALVDLPDTWIQCRDMKHAWTVVQDFHVTHRFHIGNKIQVIARVLECDRCQTQRHETYLHNGVGLDKIGQHYAYEDGYQLKGIPRGNKPQSIVQNEQYRRALERAAKHARTTTP